MRWYCLDEKGRGSEESALGQALSRSVTQSYGTSPPPLRSSLPVVSLNKISDKELSPFLNEVLIPKYGVPYIDVVRMGIPSQYNEGPQSH